MRTLFIATTLMSSLLPALGQDVPLPRERPPALSSDEAVDNEPAQVPEQGEDAEVAEPNSSPEAEAIAPPEPDRPPRVYQTQCPAVVAGLVEAELLPTIDEGECGERTPWSVTGVRVGARTLPLSAPATLSCEMATTLPAWAEMVDGYLQAKQNTELAELTVGTSYLCRETVGSSTNRVSEHGFANGLDVVGFKLGNGDDIVVQSDWPKGDAPEARVLRFAHDAACSLFSTTLGPEANAEHEDHFHLDMGCHGGSCLARLCE